MTGPSDPSGQAPPPPEPAPAAPPPPGDAGQTSGQWSQQGQSPDWAQKAQEWRPAEVAAGPAAGIAFADLSTRIIAFIIDAIILGVGYAVIVGAILVPLFLGSMNFAIYFILAAVIYGAASLIYFTYTWTTMKASPGQRILGLMTVNEGDGAALTQNQAITRWAFLFGPNVLAQVLSFGSLGLGLGSLASLFALGYAIYLLYTTANDGKRQGFHDKNAHSVVIKPNAPTA